MLAISELTWPTAQRPGESHEFWARAYPEVDTAAAKLAVLEGLGFSPIGCFPLPERRWLDNYYHPVQRRFEGFLARNGSSDASDKFYRSMEALEEALADDRPYMLGDRFTGADIMMGYSVALVGRLLGDRFPRSSNYLARVSARLAYRKVMALSPDSA